MAWRNYPPAEGTPATVLNAVANLDRVRALKRAARDAKIVSRHQEALAAARRHEELQAAKAGPETAADATSGAGEDVGRVSAPGPLSSSPVGPVEAPVLPLAVVARPAVPTSRASSKPGKAEGDELRGTGMRVPTTAATITEWAALWVRMCSEGEAALGPLNNEDARARYGLTAKQLRNVRHAAISGALRQRAITLGVELPPGYVDSPATCESMMTS